MVTTQTADSILKSYYLDVVSDQLDKSANPLLAAFRKTTADVWGRDVRKAVRIGLNGGVGAGTEEGDLPKAGGTRYAQFVSTLKNLYGTIEISDKAIRSSSTNEGAFVNLLNDEMDSLIKSSSFNFGRMLFGDGSGKLCVLCVTSEDGVTTVTADTPQNLAEGMIVDIYTNKTLSKAGVTVTSVNRETGAITLDGITPSDGEILVVQNSFGLELTGLGAIFSTEDLYGISRADNPWMNPYIATKTGAITEAKIQKAIDAIEENAGGNINFIVCSHGVRRALFSAISAYRKTESLELEGGFRALSFDGIPVVADRFCPKNTMYLLNTDDFALHQLCDWQWLEGEDGKILKQIAGKPVYTATLVKYAELLCSRPCGQGVLTGINES